VVFRLARALVSLFVMLGGVLTASGVWRISLAAEIRFVCRNLSSGATWGIIVDVEHSLADSYPARITADSITWHDTRHGGYYELDRRTGALTVRFASSTGGYALHDTCEIAH
jgi:hypothetical protein